MDQEDHICKNCAYFRQHYVKLGWSYREIKFGHPQGRPAAVQRQGLHAL